MSITQQEYVDFMVRVPPESRDFFHYAKDYPLDPFTFINGKITIYETVYHRTYHRTTLPNGLVYMSDASCDLYGSEISELPDDIVLNGSLCVYSTPIKEINVDVGGYLDIRDSDAILKDGIYIGRNIMSALYTVRSEHKPKEQGKYIYLDAVNIGGYLFKTGILS